jgi:hypothetical protein
LNLSGLYELPLAPDVKILGDRRVHPQGPLLYTRTYPHALFVIPPSTGSHERISGLRLDGGEGDDPFDNLGDEDADGIQVEKADSESDLINQANANTVSIHDNYIHHNQHPAGNICCGHAEGYGVETVHGAYAMVAHNVFTGNRHAMSGDARPGTGYFFVGVHSHFAYTHQIDMHGFGGDCSAYECGLGGEYEDVEFNTIWYSDGFALKLRGTPSGPPTPGRMDVKHNAFFLAPGTAMTETESGLVQTDNVFSVPDGGRGGQSGDFDGDGIPDDFRTTGVAWYYRSSLLNGRYVLTPSGAPFDTAPPGDQVSVVGQPARLQLKKLSGDQALLWAAANLPEGLVVDEHSGLVSGTPVREGAYTVMFGADNGEADTVNRVFHWTIAADLRTVPNMVGANRLTASGILDQAGLLLGNERDVMLTDCSQIGQILDQTPPAGSQARRGSGVNYTFDVKPSGKLHCS